MKSIRTLLLGAAMTMLCGAAFAQSDVRVAPRPDYSNQGLQRLFAATPVDASDRVVTWRVGSVEANFGDTRVRGLAALPPLPGSELRANREIPNAFALLGITPPFRANQYRRPDPLRAAGIHATPNDRPAATLMASAR